MNAVALVGGLLAAGVGTALIVEGTRAPKSGVGSTPSLDQKEIVGGALLTAGGVIAAGYGVMASARR